LGQRGALAGVGSKNRADEVEEADEGGRADDPPDELMISPTMNSTPIRPANPPPPLPDLYRRRLIAAPDPTMTADASPLPPTSDHVFQ
jgi:hypothetical protein